MKNLLLVLLVAQCSLMPLARASCGKILLSNDFAHNADVIGVLISKGYEPVFVATASSQIQTLSLEEMLISRKNNLGRDLVHGLVGVALVPAMGVGLYYLGNGGLSDDESVFHGFIEKRRVALVRKSEAGQILEVKNGGVYRSLIADSKSYAPRYNEVKRDSAILRAFEALERCD